MSKTRPGRDADHSPYPMPRSRMSRSYISSPPWRIHGGSETALPLLFMNNITNCVTIYVFISILPSLNTP
jgi:hypothetical protein